jgi:hypothetical protein
MRRTILTMATTMTLAVLVIGGVAWALTFTCTLDNCIGTPRTTRLRVPIAANSSTPGQGMTRCREGVTTTLSMAVAVSMTSPVMALMIQRWTAKTSCLARAVGTFWKVKAVVTNTSGVLALTLLMPSILGSVRLPTKRSMVVAATTISQQTMGSAIMSSAVVAPRT